MNTGTFEFSFAARRYVENVHLVVEIHSSTLEEAQRLAREYESVIGDMRAEAYQAIADFGDVLLRKLASQPWNKEGVRLCRSSSYTVKSWAGAKIRYRWLESLAQKENDDQSYWWISLMFPVPEKIRSIEEDTKLRGMFFDVIAKHRLTVNVGYEGSDEVKREKIVGLAKNIDTGIMKRREDSCDTCISFDPHAPVESSLEKITQLLRDIYAIENS